MGRDHRSAEGPVGNPERIPSIAWKRVTATLSLVLSRADMHTHTRRRAGAVGRDQSQICKRAGGESQVDPFDRVEACHNNTLSCLVCSLACHAAAHMSHPRLSQLVSRPSTIPSTCVGLGPGPSCRSFAPALSRSETCIPTFDLHVSV